MLDIDMKVAKGWFFDRDKVRGLVDEGTREFLGKAGSNVMTTARGLIRSPGKKGKSSKPGSPPKNFTGLLRDKIIFAYDPIKKTVVIGPTKLNTGNVSLDDGDTVSMNGRPTTSVLEHGGTTKIKEIKVPIQKGKKGKFKTAWVRHRERLREAYPNAPVRTIPKVMLKRPYMMPALIRNAPKLEKKLAQSIKRSFRKGA